MWVLAPLLEGTPLPVDQGEKPAVVIVPHGPTQEFETMLGGFVVSTPRIYLSGTREGPCLADLELK
jgi:hypothetical protein